MNREERKAEPTPSVYAVGSTPDGVNREGARPRKKCSALNAKDEPCRSTSVGDDGLCAMHSGRAGLGSVEVARFAGKKSGEARKARAERRRMTALDWAAKLAEENGQEIYDAYLRAIKAGEWRAADSILSRIYGKPTERIQTKPVKDVGEMDYNELIAKANELLEQAAAEGDFETISMFANRSWERAEE